MPRHHPLYIIYTIHLRDILLCCWFGWVAHHNQKGNPDECYGPVCLQCLCLSVTGVCPHDYKRAWTAFLLGTKVMSPWPCIPSLDSITDLIFNKLYQEDVFRMQRLGRMQVLGAMKKPLQWFTLFRKEGIQPDKFIFAIEIKAQSDHILSRKSKSFIMTWWALRTGFESDYCLGDCCHRDEQVVWGNLKDSWDVPCKIPSRNGVSWISMIAAYTENGYANETLKLYYQM